MRVSLNLASRPYADAGPALKRLRMAMGALVVLAGALGLGLHALNHKADQARARTHGLDSQIASVRAEQQGYQRLMQQPDNARLLTQVNSLNQMIDEKAFSWTLAMEDLETVLPSGVQVSSLEPVRAKDGHITLHLRVAGPRNDDVELVKNLEHSRRFLFPRITGESADTGEGSGQQRLQPVSASNRVDFDLLADYNPPAPGEYKAAEKKVRAEDAAQDADRNEDEKPASQPAAASIHERVRKPAPAVKRPAPAVKLPAAPHISRPNPWQGPGGPR